MSTGQGSAWRALNGVGGAVTDPKTRVPDDELDYDQRLIYQLARPSLTDTAYEDRNGRLDSEIEDRDGYQEGVSRCFYPSGFVKVATDYRYNSVYGYGREYDE